MTAFQALVRKTPLVAAPALPLSRKGGDVRLKLECLQRTGSFKLRGACLRLDALSEAERALGVVAASAGNHGLGVALAGKVLGIPVEVVVPETSPQVKRQGIAALGATVTVGGPTYDEAEHTARARAETRGAVFVSPFDDPWVIRGNGETLGTEILVEEPGVTQVVCPVGGGGLIGGLAEALAPRGVYVVGVQPEQNCAMRRSLEARRALTRYVGEPTLAEGCEGAVAQRTYDLCARHGVAVELVSEDAIRRAMVCAYLSCGVVIEPSAAVALAGVLEEVVRPAARGVTVVVLTGGNVEPTLLDDVLRQPYNTT
jgi:threonine dehydratase